MTEETKPQPIRMALTEAAAAFAETKGGEAELQAAAEEAINDLAEQMGEGRNVMDVIFHSFSYHGDYNMVMAPSEGVMVVDVSETVELPALTEGPFAGRRVRMPKALLGRTPEAPPEEGDE